MMDASRKIFLFYELCGRNVRQEYEGLKESESFSAGQLRDMQWQRLQSAIACAYDNTAYYRCLFDSLKLKPADIKSPDDLQTIPVTEKATVRNEFDNLINRSSGGPSVTYRNGGSTGEPVRIRQSKKALATYTAAQLRGRSWLGLSPGDRVGSIWGAPLNRTGRMLASVRSRLLNRTQLSAFNVTDNTIIRAFRKMRRNRIQCIYGYASSIVFFSRFLESEGVSPEELQLRAVITTSDMLLDDQKEFLESFWNCPAAGEYGAGEAGVIAHECEKRNLHITQENVYLEIVEGEVIVTSLVNQAMPILRYRLNDCAALKPGTCDCGRAHAMLANIQGRDADIIQLPDGRSLHSTAFCHVNRTLEEKGQEVYYFQIVQESLNNIRLFAVPGPSGDIASFAKSVQELVGNVDMEVEQVSEIQKTKSGKIRYTVSNIGPRPTSNAPRSNT